MAGSAEPLNRLQISDQGGWEDERPGGCGCVDGSVSVSCGEGCLRKWRGCDFIGHAGSRVKQDSEVRCMMKGHAPLSLERVGSNRMPAWRGGLDRSG